MLFMFKKKTAVIIFFLSTLICLQIVFINLQQVIAAETKQIRFITTNDLHSYLKPIYYRYLDEMKPWGAQSREGDYVNKAAIEGKIGGMAHVATMIKQLKAEKPGKNIVLDAGDTWHGAGISLFDKGV